MIWQPEFTDKILSRKPGAVQTDYIGYDIMLQYIQELLQQARAMIATGNYPQTVLDSVLENLNQAQQQIAVFQGQVKVQQCTP